MTEEKTLCVMGMFDAETERRFEAIKERVRASLCEADAQAPHITFGIYSGVSRAALSRFIGEVAKGLRRTPLFFGQIGAFPAPVVLFAAPSVTQALLDMHAKIHARYDNFCADKNCLYSLRGSRWIPHVTLATPETCRAQDVLPVLLEEFAPFTGEITHIKITEQEPLVDVCAFELAQMEDA